MSVLAHVVVGVVGALVVVLTLGSAVRTVVLPRGVASLLTRSVFFGMRGLFALRAGRAASYERRDRVFAGYAPVSLFVLLFSWLTASYLGFAALHWACGTGSLRRALSLSGASLFTLGTTAPHGAPQTALAFAEAAIGLTLLALLITYLPSLYSAFSRRETQVSKLEVRAGDPPSGAEMVWRAFTIHREEVLIESFREWEDWFVDVEESHTSFSALIFFRSPLPDHSWVTAAGAVLDAAALAASLVDYSALPPGLLDGPPGRVPSEPQLLLRAGSLALRRIAIFCGLPVPATVNRGDPISVDRDEWEAARERVAASGAPLRGNLDESWQDFAGWRVNYDQALVRLAALTMAPYAPWSSDRSLSGMRGLRLARWPRRSSEPVR